MISVSIGADVSLDTLELSVVELASTDEVGILLASEDDCRVVTTAVGDSTTASVVGVAELPVVGGDAALVLEALTSGGSPVEKLLVAELTL